MWRARTAALAALLLLGTPDAHAERARPRRDVVAAGPTSGADEAAPAARSDRTRRKERERAATERRKKRDPRPRTAAEERPGARDADQDEQQGQSRVGQRARDGQRGTGGAPDQRESPGRVDPVVRARAREALTGQRASATLRRARLQGLVAYRLARRRAADALGAPAQRAETARALEGALLLLRRSAVEAVALARELGHARAERMALERGDEASRRPGPPDGPHPPAMAGAATTDPATDTPVAHADAEPVTTGPSAEEAALVWPVRGSVVGTPGLRRDQATGTTAMVEGIEMLGRMNEPVRAVARGQVRLVEALPQGGYAVVTEHAAQQISILTGLREVNVRPGEAVDAGDGLGLLGRDLDGAPVLRFELWQNGVPIDPRGLLPAHRPRR